MDNLGEDAIELILMHRCKHVQLLLTMDSAVASALQEGNEGTLKNKVL